MNKIAVTTKPNTSVAYPIKVLRAVITVPSHTIAMTGFLIACWGSNFIKAFFQTSKLGTATVVLWLFT